MVHRPTLSKRDDRKCKILRRNKRAWTTGSHLSKVKPFLNMKSRVKSNWKIYQILPVKENHDPCTSWLYQPPLHKWGHGQTQETHRWLPREQQKNPNKKPKTKQNIYIAEWYPTLVPLIFFFYCLRNQLYSCNVLHCSRYVCYAVNTIARIASRLQLLSSTITTAFLNFLLLLIHLHSSFFLNHLSSYPSPLSLSPWFFAIRLPLSLRCRLLFGWFGPRGREGIH